MKYIGIDYGEKRVGIAISDEKAVFALPYKVLSNSPWLVDEIVKICADEKVGGIVMGESKDYKGVPNTIMKKASEFSEKISLATKLFVELEPEFMTSIHATRDQGVNEHLDASAAALILQSYLDKKNNKEQKV